MRKIKINGIYKHFKGDYMMIVVYGLDHLICF